MAHATKPERRPLVLIVDDEPLMLPLVGRILSENGYEVHLAAHGLAAKQILISGMVAPDLVLTDLKMPHLDGLQLGRTVAELFPSVPVAYMSAYDSGLAELSPEVLRDYFIAKPFSPSALLSLVRRCVRQPSAPA
jgi:two-component system OmpR family response regulator